MNNIYARFAMTLVLAVSLTGCLDFPEGGNLNTSWSTSASIEQKDTPYLVNSSIGECPQQARNLARDFRALPVEFSFVNWNIYKQNNAGLNAQLNEFAENYDVLALQEVKMGFLLNRLFSRHQLSWSHVEAFSVYERPIGVLTAAKVSPLYACKNTLSEPWIRFPKSTLMTTYAWQGSQNPLLIVNLHAINFTLGADEFNEQLSAAISAVKLHEGPVIVAGDFNTWTNKRLFILQTLTKDADLFPISYSDDVRTVSFGNPIDAIYYRGLRQLSGTSMETDASDHNPLVARFGPAQ